MNQDILSLLAKDYPNSQAIQTEIINLRAIQCLPKATEFFFSDIHGEYHGFIKLIKGGSGLIENKINLIFKNLDKDKRQFLLDLIMCDHFSIEQYPHLLNKKIQKEVLFHLLILCKTFSNNYTRSKVRKKLPKNFTYILEELLHVEDQENRNGYYQGIIQSIIDNDLAINFIQSLINLIPTLVIDRLHILGDIYDRGPRPDKVIDTLMKFQDVDITWGNHDISWMGAMCGNEALIANVIRISIRYNNFDLLEYSYGINLRALCIFAKETYQDDSCQAFIPKQFDKNIYDKIDELTAAKMHKAITIIQLKLEGQLLEKHPEYQMKERNIFRQIDWKNKQYYQKHIHIPLTDTFFPTVDPDDPLKLTSQERDLMNTLKSSFMHSSRLQKHIDYLYHHGSLYQISNGNLLFHGCVPMNEDQTLKSIEINKKHYYGQELFDQLNIMIKEAYFLKDRDAIDYMWYLWCGKHSPLFGKDKLAYFENDFLADKQLQKETLDPYYTHTYQESICNQILQAFHLSSDGKIINGHVPVLIKDGQTPIKGHKLFMIDGGLSKSYQIKTGIAGYTLIDDYRSTILAAHHIHSNKTDVTIINEKQFQTVKQSDTGLLIDRKIELLYQLLNEYHIGNK